jgi:hypothetical protein
VFLITGYVPVELDSESCVLTPQGLDCTSRNFCKDYKGVYNAKTLKEEREIIMSSSVLNLQWKKLFYRRLVWSARLKRFFGSNADRDSSLLFQLAQSVYVPGFCATRYRPTLEIQQDSSKHRTPNKASTPPRSAQN